MDVKIAFKNSSGYINNIKPIEYVADYKHITMPLKTLDLDSYDEEDFEKSIVDDLAGIAKELGNLDIDIEVYDSTDSCLGILHVKSTAVSLDLVSKADPKMATLLKNLVDQLIPYIIELKMLIAFSSATSKKLTSPIDEIKDIFGASGVPKDADSEDEIIEYINNKTKATVSKPKETLDDYVCTDVLKEELLEIKDFFENAKTYYDLGVELPKGILFKGPPGTGKTYAAKCIAGSTDCYFIQCTASALQGQYIGSGSQNIRDIFKAAKLLKEKTDKGVLIFIDEIDSFGSRDNHHGGAGGEEDRTVNQLLAEMSGFDETPGIMVLAATNYPERLDDALLRSGRFGRQINISYPEKEERESLIKYYFGKIKMDLDDVSVVDISNITEYLTPADIKSIANESAILTIRQKLSKITLDNINEAVNKTITKNIRSKDGSLDIKLVSAHEAGHTLAEILLCDSYPVKVTSYSYGDAGGFTQSGFKLIGIKPKADYINEVKILLAGRAAEEVICGKITNGASNDLEKAKKIIKNYYEYYNFEEYKYADLNQIILDDLAKYYKEVVDLFRDNEGKLNQLTDELFTSRTLYTSDLKRMFFTGGVIL